MPLAEWCCLYTDAHSILASCLESDKLACTTDTNRTDHRTHWDTSDYWFMRQCIGASLFEFPFKLAPVGKQRMSVDGVNGSMHRICAILRTISSAQQLPRTCELRLRVSGFLHSGHGPPSHAQRRPCGRSPVVMRVSMYPVGPADPVDSAVAGVGLTIPTIRPGRV